MPHRSISRPRLINRETPGRLIERTENVRCMTSMPAQKTFVDPAPPKVAVSTIPLVDVNLVTYHHEKYIARAIESVLEQKTNFDYRLLIGDDCSTDNTQSIIRDYAREYPERIQLFVPSEHRGIEHKDRVGIEVLRLNTAKYVALLDGDDYWSDPYKLQKQVDFLESHDKYALCFHNVEVFHEDQGKKPWKYCQEDQKETSTLEDLLDRNSIPTPSVMFRRSCLPEIPEWIFKLKMGDWLLHILHAQNGRVGYIDQVMAAYRIHNTGLWSKQSAIENRLEEIQMYKLLTQYLPPEYKSRLESNLARRYYQLAMDYRERGDWIGTVLNVLKCLSCNPKNRGIPFLHLVRISIPGRASL